MALVDPLTEDGMDPDLREHVQFFKGPLGVIPNSVRTMAHRAPIARAFTDLNVAVMTDYGSVTPEFKRLLGYVSSFASGCLYCQAHMILASERFGASEDRLNDVFDFENSTHFTDAEKGRACLRAGGHGRAQRGDTRGRRPAQGPLAARGDRGDHGGRGAVRVSQPLERCDGFGAGGSARSRRVRRALPKRRDGAWASIYERVDRTGSGRAGRPWPPAPTRCRWIAWVCSACRSGLARGRCRARCSNPTGAVATLRCSNRWRAVTWVTSSVLTAWASSVPVTELVLLNEHSVLRPVVVQEAMPTGASH
jgi:alkylhydroperoxidase family enzyme